MSSDPMALPEPVEQSPRAPTIYIIVVVALALLGVLTVLGGIVLGSVAVGALAGMVAPTSR